MDYLDAQPDCPYCGGKELPSYDYTFEVICRCRTFSGSVEFRPLTKRVDVVNHAISPYQKETPVGWFRTNQNPFGYTIALLDDWEVDWLVGAGVDPDGVYRVYTSKGTSIAHFRFDKGTVAWLCGKHYAATDEVRFELHRPYSKAVVLEEYAKELLQKKEG